MANYFTLQDGNLTAASVYGVSLSSAEVTNLTGGVWLPTVSSYGPTFIGNGNLIIGVAINLSARVTGPTTSTLTLVLSSQTSIITETYAVSSFAEYSNVTPYYQKWQILKLKNPYPLLNLSVARIDLRTSSSNELAVVGTSVNNNYNKFVLTTNTRSPLNSDNIHIGGALNGLNDEHRTITANTSSYENIYIHNKGTLNFPVTSNVNLTLVGVSGLQINYGGTVNVGTNTQFTLLSTTHTINLSNTVIDVNDGGTFNVYGFPKLTTTNLVSTHPISSRTFTTTNIITGDWRVGDQLAFKPNLSAKNSFDILALSSFIAPNIFTTTSNSLCTHTGSADEFAFVPDIYNLSRNVTIQGLSSNARGIIRTNGGSNTNINYAILTNLGYNSLFYNSPLNINHNSTGNLILSGCSFFNNQERIIEGANNLYNTKINNNILSGINLTLSNLNLPNSLLEIKNNSILSTTLTGKLIVDAVSGSTISMSNNIVISPSANNAIFLCNNILTGSYGGINYNSIYKGMIVSGSNTGTIIGGGINSTEEGVYVDASSNLTGINFNNILAYNNSNVGFKVSGNNLNYLTPITLNINNLSSSNNLNHGFESYNVTGNFNSLYFDGNLNSNITTSIGNGYTIFNNITSSLNYNKFLNSAKIYLSSANISASTDTPYTNGYNYNGSFLYAGNSTAEFSVTGQLVQTLNLSTVDFTMEAWIKLPSITLTYYPIFVWGDGVQTGIETSYSLILAKSGSTTAYNLKLYRYPADAGSSNPTDVSSDAIQVPQLMNNVWHHIAVVRRSGVFTFWVNGFNYGSVTPSTSINFNMKTVNKFRIGGPFRASGYYYFVDGNITGVRILKGTALYTSNFTPSRTSPIYRDDTVLLYAYPDKQSIISNLNSPRFTNINILSGLNYSQTIFANLTSDNLSAVRFPSTGLSINIDKLEEFRLENCNISGTTSFKLSSIRPKIEGSYLFYNSNSDIYGLSSLALSSYQSDVYTETGISVINENGLVNKQHRYLAAGTVSYDNSVVHTVTNIASEKLEPRSNEIKLKSSPRLIPLKSGEKITVYVYIKKSLNYTGAAPRLILMENNSMGFAETLMATSTSANDTWELLIGSLPITTGEGIAEIYVDCSGSEGSGTINIDDWDFI